MTVTYIYSLFECLWLPSLMLLSGLCTIQIPIGNAFEEFELNLRFFFLFFFFLTIQTLNVDLTTFFKNDLNDFAWQAWQTDRFMNQVENTSCSFYKMPLPEFLNPTSSYSNSNSNSTTTSYGIWPFQVRFIILNYEFCPILVNFAWDTV